MRPVVFIVSICAVLANSQPCIQLERLTVNRSYKEGEPLETGHMLAIDDIHQAYKNSGQNAIQIAFLGENSAYDDKGNVVATVHYSLNYTADFYSVPLLLSVEKYDDLQQMCKEEAIDKTFNSAVFSVGKDKYKGFGSIFRGIKNLFGNLARKAVRGFGRSARSAQPSGGKPSFWRGFATDVVSSGVQGAVMGAPGYIEAFTQTTASPAVYADPGTYGQYGNYANPGTNGQYGNYGSYGNYGR